MEIEAKYHIPDQETFQRLLGASSLAGCGLGVVSEAVLHDRYYDTAEGNLRARGYACRLRRKGDSYVATLKGLGYATGAVHRRVEHEVMLPEPLPPHQWPPSAARDLALSLCAGQPLAVLFDLRQTRYQRLIARGRRTVADMSLDRVSVCSATAAPATNLELEIELVDDGTEADLTTLTKELENSWGLASQGRSKYDRALDLLGSGPLTGVAGPNRGEERLTASERALVERLALERDVVARRARLLLAWDDDLSRDELVRRSDLSPRRVRYWLAAFRQDRLGIFPPRTLQELDAQVVESVPPVRPLQREGPKAPPDRPLWARPAGASEQAAGVQQIELVEKPGIDADDPMSEAGRALLRFHFRRMLYHESGTRLGEDIEALHDMRVATRRMRAAFRVFGGYFEPEIVVPFLKGLRRTGRALGAVRDLDVFRAKILVYESGLSETQQGSLDDLLTVLDEQRTDARERMLVYLDSKKHRRFVERFGQFLETVGLGSLPPVRSDGEPWPYRVRDVAPVAIYGRLGRVRAYDEWVNMPDVPLATLHALRIACKRLRYTLEFFSEVLGSDTRSPIKDIVAVQDHLGELQDAVVASGILRDFLVWGIWGREAVETPPAGDEALLVAPGVAAYLAAKQSELQSLLDGFPQLWCHFTRPEFRLSVANAVAVL